ncbi:MAG: hypothetical protein EB144_02710 [Actinobacteria bacterium]|nr:hypothetical protein [Actinomycetota bacterium]
MNIVVCVKQIPDPASPGALDATTHALKRDGKLILDESDAYGVEMALQLVATAGSGEVFVVSMAPNGETSGMRTALAMGAVKGLLVSDPALAGSDALTTAKVLAAAVNKLGGADLIIAGTESSDGYTGTGHSRVAYQGTIVVEQGHRVRRWRCQCDRRFARRIWCDEGLCNW